MLVIKKYIAVIFMVMVALSPSVNAQDNAFEQRLNQVLTVFKERDAKLLNQLIHPKQGFYLLTSPGAYYGYVNYKQFEDTNGDEPYPYYLVAGGFRAWGMDLTTIKEIKVAELKMYDGFYGSDWAEDYPKQKVILVSRMGIDHPFYEFIKMVQTMTKEHFPEVEQIPEDFVQQIKEIDHQTRKVEVYNNTQECLLAFYLSLIDGEWYFMAIDGVAWGDA